MESIKNWMIDAANINPTWAIKSPAQPNAKVVYENTYKLKTVVQIKLKTNRICNLTVFGRALKSFLLSSNKIFAASFIQFLNDSMITRYSF